MTFFRYPGGKSKLKDIILEYLNAILMSSPDHVEYREPFFGGGSIGINFLNHRNIKRAWINDKDIGISCLWTSVICYPELLKDKVIRFKPSVQIFDIYKDNLTLDLIKTNKPEGIVECGFQKLAIHQISYSGLGTMSGGPLGGRRQESDYGIDCRWSPTSICGKINSLHRLLSEFSIRRKECSSYGFETLIEDDKYPALIYLDPPYYVKGQELYQHAFNMEDHKRLSDMLKRTSHKWVLSYDDCPEIRRLYDWANIVELAGVKYSITGRKVSHQSKRLPTAKPELLIMGEDVRVINKQSLFAIL